MGTRAFLSELSRKKVRLNKKIDIDPNIVDAIEYIEKHSDADASVLIEEGLKKLNVVKLAKELRDEVEGGKS